MSTLNLDDRTFDDLVNEGRSLLPTVAPEWTNHNPSDPGITLIELLAYFTEMLVYRLGRVTPASKLQFLKLLAGAKWEGFTGNNRLELLKLLMGSRWEGWRTLSENGTADLDKEIECAVLIAESNELENAIHYLIERLNHNECAVTAQDFERIAHTSACAHLEAHMGAQWAVRTLCVPSANLEKLRTKSIVPIDPAHASVIVAPAQGLSDEAIVSLCGKVREDLSQHRLLTTHIHVVAPVYLNVVIRLKIALKPGLSKDQLWDTLRGQLKQKFGSDPGEGPAGQGWPFGKTLYISELIEIIDETPGVDYVDEVTILQMSNEMRKLTLDESALGLQIGIHSTLGQDALLGGSSALGPDRLVRNKAGRLVSIVLRPWELLRIDVAGEDDIGIIDTPKRGAWQ